MAQTIKRTTGTGEIRYDVRTRIGGRVVTRTFKRRRDADSYAKTTEADKLRGLVVDPARGRTTVKDYANEWLANRHDLAERTVELYRYLLDKHILPTLGESTLAGLSPTALRRWNSALAKDHPTTAAKAYRLLATIMRTAVADELIPRTPCQIKGAATETSPERPLATLAEVDGLAEAMPANLRIAVLLATWCQLRRAELLGLRRRDVDIAAGEITVRVTRTATMAGETVEKAPKTEAGRRTISVPPQVLPALQEHLGAYVGPRPSDVLLPVTAAVLRHAWDDARDAVGRPDLRLHDLRHTGLTLAGATGATTAELMHRAGHKSPAAAIRYQHATRNRDRILAAALGALASEPRDRRAMDDHRDPGEDQPKPA